MFQGVNTFLYLDSDSVVSSLEISNLNAMNNYGSGNGSVIYLGGEIEKEIILDRSTFIG